MDYGQAINNLRINRMKEKQGVFSKNIGISQAYLSQIENSRKLPSIELLERIATYVELPIPILFWDSITEDDISEEKMSAYKMLKPTTDALIKSFF